MKLSIMSYTFSRQGWKKDGRFDLEGMCRVAQELNIDGADIVSTHDLPPAEIRRVLSDFGIDGCLLHVRRRFKRCDCLGTECRR